MSSKQETKKVEVISSRRIFDYFFRVDDATVLHERPDGNMSPPLKRVEL